MFLSDATTCSLGDIVNIWYAAYFIGLGIDILHTTERFSLVWSWVGFIVRLPTPLLLRPRDGRV
jgi:hypothetical protein